MTKYKLKDICKISSSKRIFESEYTGDGVPFIRGLEITNGSVLKENTKYECYISKQRYLELKDKYGVPEKGDILMTAVGTIGNLCYINSNKEFYFKDGNVIWIKNFSSSVNSKYVYFWLQSPIFKKILNNILIGAVQKALTIDELLQVEIELPNLKYQNKVAEFLTNLEDKLSENEILSENLESVAKLIYDYWFVQFDFPDESGRPYKSSGGKMAWNEGLKREIPEGWEISSIKSLIDKNKPGNWGNETKIECSDIAVNCFRGADFESVIKNPVFTAPIRYINEKNQANFLEDGDFIVEISGGSPTQSTGRIAYVNKEFLERTSYPVNCSNFCRAFSLNKKFYQYWFLQLWNILYDNKLMFNYESKTTGIKNLMLEELFTGFKVAIPPEEIAQKYQSIVKNFYTEIQKNLKESKEIVDLRDFLLPMLMNGQVTIKDQD